MAVPILVAAAIGAALGATKHFASDVPAANKKRSLNASTQRYSPWTGLRAEPMQEPNAMGSIMSGAATGAAMGSGYQGMMSQNALNSKMGNYYESMTPPPPPQGLQTTQMEGPLTMNYQRNPWRIRT